MRPKLVHLGLLSFLIAPALTFAAYHQVKVGDTLTQIAESNYGNWVKWKDLWKLNQAHVSNPDLIYPGQRLRLLTEEELALFVKNDVKGTHSASDSEPGILSRSRRPQEWRLLPPQRWEKFNFHVDAAIDPDGFDRRSKVTNSIADKTTSVLTIASDRIPILGEITHARTEYARLFLGDQLFVRPDEELQVGTTYSITSGPQKIASKRDARVGFAYDILGKVKIVGVREGVFIGTITALYFPILRGHLLIPEVKDYVFPEPIAAPSALPASILVSTNANEDLLGQEKIVILDVGTSDGVKPGMIFRHYLHTDPHNQKDITAKDFLIEAELKVLSSEDKFSIAIILNSHALLHFGDDLVGLTDLRDFEKNQGLQTIIQDSTKPSTVDELDQMDANDGLGEKENHDLRQLEKWSKPAIGSESISPNVPSDEIMRVDTHDHPKEIYEIGKEPAPNDGTNKPTTAPTPAESPAPTLEASPTPTEPAVGDIVAPTPEPTPEASAEPAPTPAEEAPSASANDPVLDATPAPPADSNSDPFATPTPKP